MCSFVAKTSRGHVPACMIVFDSIFPPCLSCFFSPALALPPSPTIRAPAVVPCILLRLHALCLSPQHTLQL